MSDKNSDLVSLQKQLIGIVDDLSRQQESADTLDAVRAIGREIVEVNHRVTMVGQIVFKQTTDKIKAALKAVQEGKQAVDEAIGSINKLNTFVTTVTKFLGLVDKVIDTAKLVA